MSEDLEAQKVRQIVNGCRFYESKIPATDSVVLVQIISIEPTGATVALLEYGDLQGMILASEMSRRRFRNLKQVISIGKIIPCTVVRVDAAKGFVDLSKKRVSPVSAKQAEDRYASSRHVHSTLARIAYLCQVELEDIYTQFGWDLYKRYDHAISAFMGIAAGDDSVLAPYTDVDPKIKQELTALIRSKMVPRPSNIFARIEANCFGPRGVDGLRAAFNEGLKLSTDEITLRIRVIGAPLYVVSTSSVDRTKAIKAVEAAVAAIAAYLEPLQGKVTSFGIESSDKDLDIKALQINDPDDDDQDEDDDEDDEQSDYEA